MKRCFLHLLHLIHDSFSSHYSIIKNSLLKKMKSNYFGGGFMQSKQNFTDRVKIIMELGDDNNTVITKGVPINATIDIPNWNCISIIAGPNLAIKLAQITRDILDVNLSKDISVNAAKAQVFQALVLKCVAGQEAVEELANKVSEDTSASELKENIIKEENV